MSHEVLVFIMVWRLAWYSYLVYHSAKARAWKDVWVAVLLIILSAVVQRGARPYLAVAAFIVAPLLTVTFVRYQNRRSFH